MPEIVVILKQEKSGALWPFVRGIFAWIGCGVVVGVGLSVLDSPNPQLKPAQIIEALGEGWRAYETAYHAKANRYGEAPLDPIPDTAAGPVGNPYDTLDPLPNTALGIEPLVNPLPEVPALPGQSLPKQETNHVD